MNPESYSFTIVVKPYERKSCGLDDMRTIYIGKTCLVAKNSKHGGLYLNKKAKIVKGSFHYSAGSVSYPILLAKKEVHIRVENFHSRPSVETDQINKQDIIEVIDFSIQ